ncbi:MAG: hypothetical protein RLY35_1739 [Bacteroidota bacterium]|jgi:uncharacterized protein with HEPN domain
MRRKAIRPFTSYIKDMIGAIENVLEYSKDLSLHQFQVGGMSKDAIYYNFQVLGEGVKHIPFHFQNKHKNIPWMYMAALRNDIVHEYFDPDDEIVWNIIQLDLPKNLMDLQAVLEKIEHEKN